MSLTIYWKHPIRQTAIDEKHRLTESYLSESESLLTCHSHLRGKWNNKQKKAIQTSPIFNPGIITSLKHARQPTFFSYLTLSTSKSLGAK